MMGLPGLASSSSYQQQVDYGGVGAIAHQPAEDVISDLINSSYDLIGLLRDLQRSKRQREDHAQQLIHDLQRSQVCLFFFSFTLDVYNISHLHFNYSPNGISPKRGGRLIPRNNQ